MGYVEVELFEVRDGVDDAEFARRDAVLQTWCYVHRRSLVRRTTARGEGRRALVVTLFGGDVEPVPCGPGDPGSPPARFAELVDPASYRREVFRDLD